METVDSTQVEQEPTDGSPEVSQTTEVSEEVNLPVGAALAQESLKDEVATETLRRHFQGKKDKGVAEANKGVAENKTEIERLTTLMSDENREVFMQIRREDAINQLIEGNSQPVSGTEQEVEVQSPDSSIDVLAALEKAKYDLSAVTVADLDFAEEFTDQKKLELALLRRNRENPADPGTVVQPGGDGTIPTEIDEEALNAEFNSMDGQPMDMLLESGKTVRERRAEIAKLVG